MKKITASILTTLLMLSMVFSSSVFAANEEVSAWDSFLGLFSAKTAATTDVGVEYRGHVQNKGDFPLDGSWIQGPDQLGTVGESLRLEAFWIKLTNEVPAGLHIQYRVHVQNKGWMAPVEDGALAGTQGESLQIESVEIKLVDDAGNPAVGYSVEYRGHIQNKGDMPADGSWYKDGEALGTVGEFLRLEALEVKIVQTKADMTDYNAAVAAAAALTEADYTAASWTALETALTDNVVTDANTQAEVDAATAAINAAIDGLVKVTNISEVKAIKANQIQVTFNQAVDTTKATFELKKGTSAVSLKAAVWNDEGTIAVLERASSNFLAGDYVLTTSGLTDTALTNNLTIVAQKVASIEIVGDNLVKAANGQSGTFSYVVYDQYGTDITTTTTIEPATSKGTITVNKTTKVGTVNYDFVTNDTVTQVVVTLVNTATGVSTSKALTVADAAAVDTFELGDVVYPTGKTRIYENTTSAAKINYTAMDQYDNELTGDLTSAVSLISSDSNVATFAFVPATSTTDQYIRVDTKNITEAKSVVLTAVVTAKGTVTTKTLEVVLEPTATSVEFGDLSTDVLALGDTGYMDVVVTDQFGDVMTPANYVSDLNASLTATASLSGQVNVVGVKSDKNYGKIVLTPTGTKGNATIVSTLSGKTYSTTIDIQAARVLTDVGAAPNVTLIQGATKNLAFVFTDQYGEKIDTVADTADMSYAVTLTKVSGDTGAVTASAPSPLVGTAESKLNTITVDADASKTGAYTVTVELLDGSANVVSSAVTTVTVSSNVAPGLTYSVSNIPTLPAFGTVAVDGTSAYAQPVNVKATDTNGNEVVINPDQILDVEVLNDPDGYIAASTAQQSSTITAQDGHWLVGAAMAADADAPTNAKLRVTINTNNGVQVLESNVITFNSAAVAAQDLAISTLGADPAVPTQLDEDATILSDFEYQNIAGAKTGTTAYLMMKDQYGIWTEINADAVVSSPANVIALGAGDKFSFATATHKFNLTDDDNSTDYAADTAVNLSIVKDGIVEVFTVTMTDVKLAPNVTSVTQSTVSTTITSAETVTIVFNKNLSSDSKANVIAQLEDEFALVLDTSANVTAAGSVTFTDDKTAVVTAGTMTAPVNVSAINGGNVTFAQTDVVDVFGNEAAAAISTAIPTV